MGFNSGFKGLSIQHAMRVHHFALLSSVACLALLYFPTLSHKRHDFRKKGFEHKMCFDFLYNFYLNISHSKNNSARYHKCVVVDVKYPLFLSGFIGT